MLVWAACGARDAFTPPPSSASTLAAFQAASAWPPASLAAAQRGCQSAVASAVSRAAAASAQTDAWVQTDAWAQNASGGGVPLSQQLGGAEGMAGEDACSASVACAMLFEAVGSACGALASGGCDRALRVFRHCTVRCLPLLDVHSRVITDMLGRRHARPETCSNGMTERVQLASCMWLTIVSRRKVPVAKDEVKDDVLV